MTSLLTSNQLRPALDAAMDARGANLEQEALIFDPDPEVNSLAEYVSVLLRHGVPAEVIANIATLLRRLAQSNAVEGACERTTVGVLDRAVADLHHDGRRTGLTVKDAAERLRPHLRAIAPLCDGVTYFRACCAIRDVLAQVDEQAARGSAMRNQLGAGRHDLLLSLLPLTDSEVAA
jgi:hypothetical protein